ncbi:hypothetical protein SAMN04488523_11043 [Sulfitobacter brevis]|uniref:Uncharacterized protein n=1 Tax=Sulfitobacter brevis TaxID=74348 RepID=A0A1I2D4U2_9RHOB|nr:hypothetical protein [Sulfitobacter brevis]SFE75548.1 hypothetical protein SAMN04488523_11043 [Sulfitobacter brevis]
MGKPKLKKFKGDNDNNIFDIDIPDVKVDGKKGFDAVILPGEIGDYTIEQKGKKFTLTDDDGGIYKLKKIESVVFDGDTVGTADDMVFNTSLGTVMSPDTSIDLSGQTTGGNLLVGSGIPASDFVVVRSEADGLELGLSIIYRQGPSVDPVSVDPDGTVHFLVNDGSQSTVNGSSDDNAGRAAWSFQYSAITGLNGETTDLGDFTFMLKIDVDVTEGVDYRTFTMVDPGFAIPNATGMYWVDEDNTPVIGDDGGNTNVAQNSENFAFGFINNYIDADPDTPGMQSYTGDGFPEGEFDIVLEAYNAGGDLIASNHIVVDVFDFI